MKRGLASDNYAGVLPEMLEAIAEANRFHAKSYGYDDYTEKAKQEFAKHFGSDVEVTFVFNGTGANVLGIGCATESFNSILCADTSHLYVDESTAPETFTSCRLISLGGLGQVKVERVFSVLSAAVAHQRPLEKPAGRNDAPALFLRMND